MQHYIATVAEQIKGYIQTISTEQYEVVDEIPQWLERFVTLIEQNQYNLSVLEENLIFNMLSMKNCICY